MKLLVLIIQVFTQSPEKSRTGHFPLPMLQCAINKVDYGSRCDFCKLLTLLAVFLDICAAKPGSSSRRLMAGKTFTFAWLLLSTCRTSTAGKKHLFTTCNHPHISNQCIWSSSSPSSTAKMIQKVSEKRKMQMRNINNSTDQSCRPCLLTLKSDLCVKMSFLAIFDLQITSLITISDNGLVFALISVL